MSASIAEFEAARHILQAPTLYHRTRQHINSVQRTIAFDQFVDQPWSDGEWVLIQTALSMWNGFGGGRTGELVTKLDDGSYRRVLEALQIRRPARLGVAS